MEEALAGAEQNRLAGFLYSFPPDETIRCLTLPHHNPAAGLSVYALQQSASWEDKPEVVIIIGPNHANAGPAAAVTSARWQTPYGMVNPDKECISTLIGEGHVEESVTVFEPEHSIGTIIPWIAKFLPDAKVVPMIFHYQYPLTELQRLFTTLEPWLGQDSLLILSVDFSHHHTREEAERLDQHTSALLERNDWRSIARLSSDYLDCPTLLASIVCYSSSIGLKGPELLAHTNTGYLNRISDQEVTSYMILAYTKPPVQ